MLFTSEMKKLKAQRGDLTGVKSHQELVAELELNSFPDPVISNLRLFPLCHLLPGIPFVLFASNLPLLENSQ